MRRPDRHNRRTQTNIPVGNRMEKLRVKIAEQVIAPAFFILKQPWKTSCFMWKTSITLFVSPGGIDAAYPPCGGPEAVCDPVCWMAICSALPCRRRSPLGKPAGKHPARDRPGLCGGDFCSFVRKSHRVRRAWYPWPQAGLRGLASSLRRRAAFLWRSLLSRCSARDRRVPQPRELFPRAVRLPAFRQETPI